MNVVILVIFLISFYYRFIYFPPISLRNEINLKNNNAKEYGPTNSYILGVLHFLFYNGAIVEASINKTQVDVFTLIGTITLFLSFSVLFYINAQLKELWTVKVIIAENHQLNTSFLFKYIRHPNYFLNLIPELIGLALVCKSFYVFMVIFPLFCITLVFRIRIEEKAMKTKFINY